MSHWSQDAIFYQIYPLGLCDAPVKNDYRTPIEERLKKIHSWLDHLNSLGVNALYLGPVFESVSHGYDTTDYFQVDRRLGTNETLKQLVMDCHQHGIRVILDGVFNHVGRDFWAFRDLRQNQTASPYRDWFSGLHFGNISPFGDPFSYEGWNGHYNLVRLNLKNPAVSQHLLQAAAYWIKEFDIDGIRLDAADCVDRAFQQALASQCRELRQDFWLLGEIVAGDYNTWAHAGGLDSVTNYECYKGLYSSLNDKNYFEIAFGLNRQSGREGIYRHLSLYNFIDNHDVNRIASTLKNPAHLYPIHTLLFTMPGIPSLYYGSEFGIEGKKNIDDLPLRPNLDLDSLYRESPHPDLLAAIRRLSHLRKACPALRYGDYAQVFISHEVFAFSRKHQDQTLMVVINAAEKPVEISLPSPWSRDCRLIDVLNNNEILDQKQSNLVLQIPSCWARVITSN